MKKAGIIELSIVIGLILILSILYLTFTQNLGKFTFDRANFKNLKIVKQERRTVYGISIITYYDSFGNKICRTEPEKSPLGNKISSDKMIRL